MFYPNKAGMLINHFSDNQSTIVIAGVSASTLSHHIFTYCYENLAKGQNLSMKKVKKTIVGQLSDEMALCDGYLEKV